MKEAGEKTIDQSKKLSDAIRDVKNAFADRDDVVVDMREAHRMRLDRVHLASAFCRRLC